MCVCMYVCIYLYVCNMYVYMCVSLYRCISIIYGILAFYSIPWLSHVILGKLDATRSLACIDFLRCLTCLPPAQTSTNLRWGSVWKCCSLMDRWATCLHPPAQLLKLRVGANINASSKNVASLAMVWWTKIATPEWEKNNIPSAPQDKME